MTIKPVTYKSGTCALLLSFPLLLTGCNPSSLPLVGRFFGGGAVKEVSINVWGLWESESTLQPVLNKYMAAHPTVKIHYEDRSIMPLVDYKERVFTRAFEGIKPDIVLVHSSWVPRLAQGGGAWAVPSNVFEKSYIDNNFFPVVRETSIVGGNLYSLPSTYDGLVLVYNKKHFEEVGISKPPADWEEFRRDAISLTVRNDTHEKKVIVRAGAAMGLADNIDHFSDVLGLMWAQAGVGLPDAVASTQAIDALTFYTNFAKEDGVWDATMPESLLAFASGKVSMVLVPTWRLYELLPSMPDASVIGTAPVPQALTDNPVSWASYWTWVVPKSSPNPNESWDVVKFLVDPEQQTVLFSGTSKLRQFGIIYSDVSLAQNLSTNAYLKPAVETASYAKTWEIAGRAGNRRQIDALKATVNDVLAGKDAKESLTNLKTELSK